MTLEIWNIHIISLCLTSIRGRGIRSRSRHIRSRGRGISRLGGIGSRGISLLSRVDWGALEAHISNKASLVGGSVSGGLETAIGESDGVGPSNVACNVKINKKVGLGILVKQRNKQICLIISN